MAIKHMVGLGSKNTILTCHISIGLRGAWHLNHPYPTLRAALLLRHLSTGHHARPLRSMGQKAQEEPL